MNNIQQVVKERRDGYYAPLYRLLGLSRQGFYHRRIGWHGLDFTDEQYQVMADYLGVSVGELKGTEYAGSGS